MKILVTGFDPFGGETVNPAIESVKRLPDRIGNAEIIKLEIPTVIVKSVALIKAAIGLHHPDVVLSVGQAGGRPDITVERVGINIDDCRISDNEGNQPVDMKVVVSGPDAYFTTLPIKAMVENIKASGIPASISNSAGTFICNHVLYGVSHIVATQYPAMKSGFIHIPFLPQQVLNKPGMPSMTLDAIVQGLVCAIETIAENQTDIKTTGGTVH